MVEDQLARRGIRDRNVITAMRTVPREKFVDPGLEASAYEDGPLSIGEGQTISQPYIVALMIEKADLDSSDKVLEVGTGSGYASALISLIAMRVYSIERHGRLALQARERFETLGYRNIDVRIGDGSKGWAEAAPFDAIIVSAAAPEVPSALKEQLDLRGRLIIPVGRGDKQRLKRVMRTGAAAFEEEDLGGVLFVPLIGEDAWTAVHPMYTATVPTRGAFEPQQSYPQIPQEVHMREKQKLHALPEGVFDHAAFQKVLGRSTCFLDRLCACSAGLPAGFARKRWPVFTARTLPARWLRQLSRDLPLECARGYGRDICAVICRQDIHDRCRVSSDLCS